MDGVLVIDKPAGLTSHDVVQQVRMVLNQPKVGHFGTLDPLATGVLPIALGKATRLQQFYVSSKKIYRGSIRFGFSTTTYDAEGTPTSTIGRPDLQSKTLEASRKSFLGEIDQIPPAFSAKKINGVSAHRLARKNKPVSLSPQKIYIYQFDVRLRSTDIADFEVECSSGTYVRSLAHDLGQALGCGAHLIALRRVASGEFTLEQALEFSMLKTVSAAHIIKEQLIRLDALATWIPGLKISEGDGTRVKHGRSVRIDSLQATRLASIEGKEPEERWVRLFNGRGELLGLGLLHPSPGSKAEFELKPRVILSNP